MAGIDSIVNTRADAFTNNPQALMQRYAMGQDLLDLLALQKLKQDKEAAARSLQMNMQAPQGTIKDQLNNQVMDMTKQEVASSLAPGIQQQGQRMAAQQAQNMMGAGLPTQPAPALVGMAGGGIVGYAEGVLVEGAPYSRAALARFDERRRLEQKLRDAEIAEAEAKAIAQDPVSAQNVLRSSMNVRNMPSETSKDIESVLSAGTPERDIPMSLEALRRFDERRNAEENESNSSMDSISNYQNAMRLQGEGHRALYNPQDFSKEYVRTVGNPDLAVDREPTTPFGRGIASLRDKAQRELDEIRLNYELFKTYNSSANPLGLFKEQTDEERARAKTIMDLLPSLSYADKLVLAATGELPNEANIRMALDEDGYRTPSKLLPLPQEDYSPVAAPTTEAAPATTQTTTPVPSARDNFYTALLEALNAETPSPVAQAAERPPFRSRYEDRLAEIEAEKQDRLGALIEFLQAAGASGGTNLGATLMGGGSGLRARDERLRQQETEALKGAIEDENTYNQRMFNEEQARQLNDYRNRQLAQEKALGLAGIAAEAAEGAEERANRLDVAELQVAASLNEAQSRFDASMYTSAAEAKAEQLTPINITTNYPDLVDAYAKEWKAKNKAPGFTQSMFTGADEEYEEQAKQEGIRQATIFLENQINSYFGIGSPASSGVGGANYSGFSATRIQ